MNSCKNTDRDNHAFTLLIDGRPVHVTFPETTEDGDLLELMKLPDETQLVLMYITSLPGVPPSYDACHACADKDVPARLKEKLPWELERLGGPDKNQFVSELQAYLDGYAAKRKASMDKHR